MTRLVAALDGGGTKTQGAMADAAGQVWLTPAAPGCNPQDNPDWAINLRTALAHFAPDVAQMTLGLPGFGEMPETDTQMLTVVKPMIPDQAQVMNDVAMAYHGAFPQGGGVLILAGTGSMAMADGPLGLVRVGGWGDGFGDEGSAHWIGRSALSRASQMQDGRLADTGFAAALTAELGVDATQHFALLTWVMAQPHPRSAIASVARHVDHLADTGQATARKLLREAAAQLHLHVAAAARKAGFEPPFRWCKAGSVFRSTTVTAALGDLIGHASIAPRFDALGGGLCLAATAAGWPVNAAWLSRTAAALAALHAQRTMT